MSTREFTVIPGDCIAAMRAMPDESVNCCVTSPPYYWGLRDYGSEGQIGLERTPQEYVQRMVEVFSKVRRVLKSDGTLWLNLGDSYQGGNRGSYSRERAGVSKNRGQNASDFGGAPNRFPIPGLKPKDLVGVPWRVAFALQADGWYLRSDIIWSKPNPMPESVTDRPTKAHEYLFLLAKSEHYYYDSEAIKEPSVSDHGSGNGFKRDARLSYMDGNGPRGNDEPWEPNETATRNKRTVWTVTTQPFAEAHFAVYPPLLIEPCILAGSPEGGLVLDPFAGSGTTGMVALRHGRNFIGLELNPTYCEMARRRIAGDAPLFNGEDCGIYCAQPQ